MSEGWGLGPLATRPLPDDAVLVWWARPDALEAPEVWQACLELVDDAEREKQSRFRLAENRREYLAAHSLLRCALSAVAGPVPASRWRFETGPHGRPSLASGQARPELRFNLSHTRGLVACAIALEREVGVDVERVERAADPGELAQRYFSKKEVAQLLGLPESRRGEAFLRLWTLKESYLKARGTGLALPLDGFSFVLAEPGTAPAFEVDAELRDDARRWCFWELRPSPEHLLAVAATLRGDGRPVLHLSAAGPPALPLTQPHLAADVAEVSRPWKQ